MYKRNRDALSARKQKNPRVLLVFPPFDYSILIPEIGIPVLTANLRKAGCEVRQADLNMEFMHLHLGNLKTLALALESITPTRWPGEVQGGDEKESLLERIARGLRRMKGLPDSAAASMMDVIREQEMRTGKSCQLRGHQILWDWGDKLREMKDRPAEDRAIAGPLARLGSQDLRFRRDLLRVIHNVYFLPRSYYLQDVVGDASRPNPFLDPFYDEKLNALFGDLEPDVLGISIWSTNQLIPAMILARKARELRKELTVVAGGAWCTYARTVIPRAPELFSFFNFFVVHESERSMIEMMGLLGAGRKVARLPNLIARAGRGVESGAIAPPSPLARIEHPDYDGFPMNLYPERQLTLRLFRGCYWSRCTFCTHTPQPYSSLYSQRRSAVLSRGLLERAAAHITDVKAKYGIDSFTMADNLLPPGIMKQFSRLVIERKLDVTWSTLARFEKEYTRPFCRLLRRGGCTRFDLGLEIASEEALRKIRKGITLPTVTSNLRNLAAEGIRTKVFVINYPGETKEEYEATLEFLVRHSMVISEVAISRFSLACGTAPRVLADRSGVTLREGPEPWLEVFSLPYDAPGEIPFRDLVEITRRHFPRHW